MTKNIFIYGANDFDLAQLRALGTPGDYTFHELFTAEEVLPHPEIPIKQILKGATNRLAAFPDHIDGIVGYWDFPVSTTLPLLREPYGLSSPTFEAVLRCEHKYWSRVEQQQCIPEHIPDFCAMDPFADNVAGQITVDYPYWIKPVKSVQSYLGFRVEDEHDLDEAIERTRAGIYRMARPFNHLLESADLPPEIAEADGKHCIVESIISQGHQCTLEGWAHGGEVEVYGVVDSIREGKHRSSFSRYQYPSHLPAGVQKEMVEITQRFLKHIGYENSTFNVEYYWNEETGQIHLLEINTRLSKSHAPLFAKVDGLPHYKVMVDVALGQRPDFPHREGQHSLAAKFMWRVHHDATVHNVPSPERLAEIHEELDGIDIKLQVEEDMQLSELQSQDSYSFQIAEIFVGGESEDELLAHYQRCQELIGLELVPVK